LQRADFVITGSIGLAERTRLKDRGDRLADQWRLMNYNLSMVGFGIRCVTRIKRRGNQ
jgi:hypothetical protein